MPTMDAPAKAEDNSLTSGAPSSEGAARVSDPEFAKPVTDVGEAASSNKVELKKEVTKKIKVVATQSGFYNNRRIVAGEQFYIKGKEHFGSWFTCEDEELEEQRKDFVRNRTLNARKKAQSKKARE